MATKHGSSSWATFSGDSGEKSGAGAQEGISVWVNESLDICVGFENAGDYYCLDPHQSRTMGMFLYESSQRIINDMNNMSGGHDEGEPW